MVTIFQAVLPDHRPEIHDIFKEYLEWACPILLSEYQVHFDAQAITAHDMETLEIFMPPAGSLLLAHADENLAGMACMRTIGPRLAEIKRMYVRPAYRRLGIGRQLVAQLVDLARASGNLTLRLDSARFMTGAHALYKSCGFHEVAPYPQSEIPPEHRRYWVFMERALDPIHR